MRSFGKIAVGGDALFVVGEVPGGVPAAAAAVASAGGEIDSSFIREDIGTPIILLDLRFNWV